MENLQLSPLPDRGILAITGPDSRDFLQGLISNDISLVTPDRAIYAALLTPQGKYLFDFIISQDGDRLLVDCEKARLGDLSKRLRMYKLRADAAVTDETDNCGLFALWGEGAAAAVGLANGAGTAQQMDAGVVYVDPRLKEAGVRMVLARDQAEQVIAGLDALPVTDDTYDLHRLQLGLPDASRDLIPEKSILLESGFDDLNGINWDKGCYMGQELTARTKYRGLVKKRLTPVSVDGEAPAPGTQIMCGDKVAGEMRSSRGPHGMALLRLEHLEAGAAELSAEGAKLRAVKPAWAGF